MSKDNYIEEVIKEFDEKCMNGDFGSIVNVFSLKLFLHTSLTESYNRGMADAKPNEFTLSMLAKQYEVGKSEGIIEHCAEPNCPECNHVAYEKGKSDRTEEIEKWVKSKYKDLKLEHLNYDIGYNQALDDLLQELKK